MEPLEYRLRETLPLVHVRSLYRYGADPAARRLVFLLKYHGSPEAGVWMGRQLAEHLRDTDFFRDVDCLLPVPLHPKRQRHRGYNQAECIARGVAEVTGLPVCTDAVRRVVNTHTQTRLDPLHRRKNMAHVFQPAHAAPLAGKHVVIVDDVLTTGSTVTACAQALGGVPGLRVSILTFAYAEHRV
jgi:ComF family protein